ncbi:IS3 family transposase [Peribacillus sp. FSL M8-0224]
MKLEYIHYYNHQLFIVKLKGMSPVDKPGSCPLNA